MSSSRAGSNQGVEKYVSRNTKRRILAGDIPPWITKHPRRAYLISSFLAAPLWVRSTDFKFIRQEADALTLATGVKHVLDHLVPVSHPYVCGLTVPWNVVSVPRLVNAAKSNKWHPDQEEFDFGR